MTPASVRRAEAFIRWKSGGKGKTGDAQSCSRLHPSFTQFLMHISLIYPLRATYVWAPEDEARYQLGLCLSETMHGDLISHTLTAFVRSLTSRRHLKQGTEASMISTSEFAQPLTKRQRRRGLFDWVQPFQRCEPLRHAGTPYLCLGSIMQRIPPIRIYLSRLFPGPRSISPCRSSRIIVYVLSKQRRRRTKYFKVNTPSLCHPPLFHLVGHRRL